METTKHWLRPTQLTRTFPTNKYFFSEYLQRVGDTIESPIMPIDDITKLKHAAYAWAYARKWRIKTERIPAGRDVQFIRISLVAKHRFRDFS
jgi:hypothetical protein